MKMWKGLPLFLAGCLIVCALIVIPPEYGRWVAMGLLVVMVLTPAVQPKPRTRAVRPRGERGS